MPSKPSAWRCSVCGYIHRGPEPPELCPVCGAASENFQPYADPAPPAPTPTNQWRCLICGYVHTGAEPPEACPVCGATASRFEPLGEAAEKTPAAGKATKIVIAGAGIAGIAAVESIREVSPEADITLVSREPELPYYRLNLTRYLAGEVRQQDLPIHPENWYHEQHVRLLRGVEVTAIRLDDHLVEVRGGETLRFEKLLLAAGSHPLIPPFPGTHLDGVTGLRTIEDAQHILAAGRPGSKCVCIGGGSARSGNGRRVGAPRGRRDPAGRLRLAVAAPVESAGRRNPGGTRRPGRHQAVSQRPHAGDSRPAARPSACGWRTAASLRPTWW